MTELAYLADPAAAYVRSFRARVTALPPGGVVLDRTYFYATGGGQPADRGTLGAPGAGPAEVVDVARSGAAIVHRLRGPPETARSIRIGDEVDGTIDWERRHRHMRLHTGQHLLSARAFARYGRRTRRAQMEGRTATLDLDGEIPEEALGPLAEDLAEAVRTPRAVAIRFLPRAEWERHPAGRSGLVPLPPQVDPVRVIEIDGTDACPCGGTHLRSTGELGAIVLARERGGGRLVLTLAPDGDATPRP
ncbi:MAG TPA: alanyl-tRNA editing protein [Thermoplasmata archaeon]|nr:alanyl-tRNA editing protein [Thermoplasmata archaeon]